MRNLTIVIALVISALGAWSSFAEAQPGNGRPIPQTEAQQRTVRPEPPISDETIKAIVSVAAITLASCTIILFVLGCGSRVVVFADGSDALMTACIFIAPIVTALALLGIGVLTDFDNQPRSIGVWAFARENPVMAFALGIGLLWWAWALIGTVVSSIRHNGLIIGSLVAVMKLGAVFTMLFAWFASEHAKTPDYRGYGPHLIFLGILAWFASRYVNGHRVMERREMMMVGRGTSTAEA